MRQTFKTNELNFLTNHSKALNEVVNIPSFPIFYVLIAWVPVFHTGLPGTSGAFDHALNLDTFMKFTIKVFSGWAAQSSAFGWLLLSVLIFTCVCRIPRRFSCPVCPLLPVCWEEDWGQTGGYRGPSHANLHKAIIRNQHNTFTSKLGIIITKRSPSIINLEVSNPT